MVRAMQPQILPRKEHRISRKHISQNVLRTLYRLRDKGFIAYLVGGCVRDLLLERTPKDFDIATNATPNQIKRLFRNCRLVGRRFRLAHLYFSDGILEVSTFRASAPSGEEETEEPVLENRPPRHLKDSDGMVLRDNVFGTPEEDALRRDFTINALAYSIEDFSVIDYSTGLSDLREGLIRPIGDPYERFTEDPVRMLRAVRFAATHSFTIEKATWEVICRLSFTISRASPARLYEEMLKLFLMGSARPVFDLLETSGLLATLFPPLGQWLSGSSDHRAAALAANLEGLDRLFQSGTAPSPALFFAVLFGPSLEEGTLEHQRDGIPRQQSLDAVCTAFLQELRNTVSVPVRIGAQMRTILAMQTSLHKRPPRRPAIMVGRAGFADALAYLRLAAERTREHQAALKWWEAYLSEIPVNNAEPAPDEAQVKRRKKRRRRHRPAAAPTAAPPSVIKE